MGVNLDDVAVGVGGRKVALQRVAVEVEGDVAGGTVAYREVGRQGDVGSELDEGCGGPRDGVVQLRLGVDDGVVGVGGLGHGDILRDGLAIAVGVGELKGGGSRGGETVGRAAEGYGARVGAAACHADPVAAGDRCRGNAAGGFRLVLDGIGQRAGCGVTGNLNIVGRYAGRCHYYLVNSE